MLNVALGGTLFQDIETLHPGGRVHRNWEIYDQHAHELAIEPGSAWRAGTPAWRVQPLVNSVHHQGLHRLGRGLTVEARSVPDGVVEAVRLDDGTGAFAYGVQWHPEFIFNASTTGGVELLTPRPLLDAFLSAVDAASPSPSGRTP